MRRVGAWARGVPLARVESETGRMTAKVLRVEYVAR
jgi:hypothetical protein